MFEVLLPLDRGSDVRMTLAVDKALQTVAPGEIGDCSDTVLPSSTREIARETDIQNAIWAVRNDIDPSSPYEMIIQLKNLQCNRSLDGRVKPGHDGEGV
jgi:hypothetical protein